MFIKAYKFNRVNYVNKQALSLQQQVDFERQQK